MDIIIEIVKQNCKSKVNHKFEIVWIEMQTGAEYMQDCLCKQ